MKAKVCIALILLTLGAITLYQANVFKSIDVVSPVGCQKIDGFQGSEDIISVGNYILISKC